MTAEPLFDAAQVEELDRLVGRATGGRLIETFLGSLRDLAAEIEAATAARAPDRLRAAAHSLAGAALSIGTRPLGNAARGVQDLCDQGDSGAAFAAALQTLALARDTEAALVRFAAERPPE